MERTSVAAFLVIFFLAYAECALAQSTYTAATCNRSDVNAIISGPTHVAVDGDVIQIPAGTCTWTSPITPPAGVGISILGTGTPNSTPATFGPSASCTQTTIVNNSINHLFVLNPNATASLSRLSCLKILTTNASNIGATFMVAGICNASTCPNLRIDNITLDPSLWEGDSAPLPPDSGAKILVDNVFGVIDHTSITAGAGWTPNSRGEEFSNSHYSAWQGIGHYGDKSYSAPDTFGTAQTLYFENNIFGPGAVVTENESQAEPSTGCAGQECQGGTRYALRFNQCNSCIVLGSWHGTESNGRPRSGRQGEVYGNTMSCTYASGCQLAGPRGGVMIVFGNTVSASGSGHFSEYVNPVTYRISQSGLSQLWQPCPGPWDSASPVICLDQPGRSGGTYLSGTSGTNSGPIPTGWANEVLDPLYEWNDRGQAPGTNVGSDWSGFVANRDYYSDNSGGADRHQTSPTSPFNGTSGVGWGTLANRPSTCTPGISGAPGVGYFATNSGPNWNNGSQGGQFFVCSSSASPNWQQAGTNCTAAGSNFWCLYYTPYTYPHPLVTGTLTGLNKLGPPTSLRALVQ